MRYLLSFFVLVFSFFVILSCDVSAKKKSIRTAKDLYKSASHGTRTPTHAAVLFSEWKDLLDKPCVFDRYVTFLKDHGDWPLLDLIQKKAEQTLSYQDQDFDCTHIETKEHLRKIVNFFKDYPPLTGRGQFIFARGLVALSEEAAAKKAFSRLITEFIVPQDILSMLSSFVSYLPFTWAAQQANFALLMNNDQAAEAAMTYADNQAKKIIHLRRQVQSKDQSGIEEAQKMLKTQKGLQDLAFDVISYYVSVDQEKYDNKAFDLIKDYTFVNESIYPEVYWKVRHRLARNLINQKRFKDAYIVLKPNGYIKMVALNQKLKAYDEDTITAITTTCWLGIAFGNDSLSCLTALQNLEPNVQSPISKARILFWMAKAYVALNQSSLGVQKLLEASSYKSTFYGQIAISMLKRPEFTALQKIWKIKITLPKDNLFPNPIISNKKRRQFESLDLVRVIYNVPDAINLQNRDLFFNALLELDNSVAFRKMIFELAHKKISLSYAILMSKRKHMTFRFVYPLLRPSTCKDSIDKIVPKTIYKDFLPALVHAIIRRESAFDESAISHKNAKGLMQMIDATASSEVILLKKNFGLSVSQPINLLDKKTNLTLGTSHLYSVLKENNGNLVLTLATYNAGPKPVERWMSLFGNPEDPKVDIINWIEFISYSETRNYVQRVLENLTIYEQLLNERSGKKVTTDLMERIKPRMKQSLIPSGA